MSARELFYILDKVVMTDCAVDQGLAPSGKRTGTVLGYGRESHLIRVGIDGQSSATTYNMEYWEHVVETVLPKLHPVVGLCAAEMGRRGGKKTAERGPGYFRDLAAKRKTRAGGRPRKDASPARKVPSND